MMDAGKYRAGYYQAPGDNRGWVKRDRVTEAPVWCSVDLRDGNQSLVIPMNLEEKLEFFRVLLGVGFREIEVGFPAASETEFAFVRRLIEDELIPDGVTIQVLTQCREPVIRKTFEACRGASSAIIHFYNSISAVQREQVFMMDRDEVRKIAVDGAKLVKELASEYEGNFRFEYSPESFTGTEPEYALEVCNAVLDVLLPGPNNRVIINLPATVEMSLPHVYASQIEYMHRNLKYREYVTLSLHPHNDRGTGVADAELALLAGAERVEGTLFGNGERTGNVDIVTLALNMYSHGVDPGLDFSDIPYLVDEYEKCTRMRVGERAPYAGSLVFAAFSGSHQDAIAKGLSFRAERRPELWSVPYLPIDPADIGRGYDAGVIRVNSQSGKGGIGFILEKTCGYVLPDKMRSEFSAVCKEISDREHRELMPEEIARIFRESYLDIVPAIDISDMEFRRENGEVRARVTFEENGVRTGADASGNGSLSAVSNALKAYSGRGYTMEVFSQHSLEGEGFSSAAISYIGIKEEGGRLCFGAGIDTDVVNASTKALLAAFDNMTRSHNLHNNY